MDNRIEALEENARLLSAEVERLRHEVQDLKDEIVKFRVLSLVWEERINALAYFDVEGSPHDGSLQLYAILHPYVAKQGLSDALRTPYSPSVWKQAGRPQTTPETPRTVET